MLPALSLYFGLKWLDIADMPPAELHAYLDALRVINEQRSNG